MKKNIALLAGGIAFALAFQACQPKVDMTAINAKVDSLVNVQVDAYKKQLMDECSAKVKTAAATKAQEIIDALTKGGKKTAPKPAPAPAPKKEDKKDGGKIIDKTNDGKMIDKMNKQGGGKLIDKMGGKTEQPK